MNRQYTYTIMYYTYISTVIKIFVAITKYKKINVKLI